MPGGRPTIFRQDLIDVVFKLALLGAKDAQIADIIGVAPSTYELWKKTHPELMESLKKGKDLADATIANSLYHRANGYSHESVKIFADAKSGEVVQVPFIEHYPPDTGAAIFWLKNRQPERWRDKIDIVGEGLGGQTLVQINIIGANGEAPKSLLDGKVEIGRGIEKPKGKGKKNEVRKLRKGV